MHNQYLEGTSQQTKSTKQKHPGRNNTSCFTLEYQHKWNKLYIPVGEEKNQTNYKKRKVELHPYSILHLSWNNNYDNTTLITFQRVNTSAEWIKKEKSKKGQLAAWALPEQSYSTVSSETTTATNQWSTISPHLGSHARTCSLPFKWP